MSRVVLRVAQVIGILVLAGIAIGIAVGLVQGLLGILVIVAIPVGAWWIYKRVSDRKKKASTLPPVAPAAFGNAPPKAVAGGSGDRRSELESRAVLDASGRCGWCGSASLHKDEFGFPTTPLTYHRAEIDGMLERPSGSR